MRCIYKILIALASLGLGFSILVHLSTYLGFDPQEFYPPVWLLHLGVFVVFLPAVFVNRGGRSTKCRTFSDLFPHAPRWMVLATIFFFVYAAVNFAIFFALMHEGNPIQKNDGTYELSDHGRLVRKINEDDFHRYRSYEMRGASGHWMLFYAVAATLLVSAYHKRY